MLNLTPITFAEAEALSKAKDKYVFFLAKERATQTGWQIVTYDKSLGWEYGQGAFYGDTLSEEDIVELYRLPQ